MPHGHRASKRILENKLDIAAQRLKFAVCQRINPLADVMPPCVATSSSARPVVDFPQPDSPTKGSLATDQNSPSPPQLRG
jgi:hypothetical protein